MDLYSRATDEFRQGNLEQAAGLSRDALKEASTNSAVEWRDVAAVELNLSHILKLLSRLDEAKDLAESALKKLDAHFSSNKLEVCHALDVVAELCCEKGLNEEALKYVDRAIELKSRQGGVASLALARSYNIRGAILLNYDRIPGARSDYLRALAINVRHHGRDRPLPLATGITLSNIGGVLRKEGGRTQECVSLYREVVSSFEVNLNNPEQSWMFGSALTDLAEALIDLGCGESKKEAKTLLARSLHVFLSTRGTDHPSTERAAVLLKQCAEPATEVNVEHEHSDFVETLLNECEKILPKQETKISGDIIFLDRRGHVGHGHPHTPII
jgi:tetratricopeptide (TPR) repeat protein